MIEKMKSVCVITQACQRDKLLETLREMGILHIAEKKAAKSEYLERYALISKMIQELKEYTAEQTEVLLTDVEFEPIYKGSVEALDRKAALTVKKGELTADLERIRIWGEFDTNEVRSLPDKLDLHFYRVDKSHSKETGGTGLGLSIVKHAVQYHNGKISMESQPDAGTTISVVFEKALG